MRKLYRVILLFFAFSLPFFSLAFALETDTHEEINEFVTTNILDGFSLDSYLQNQLGFENGIDKEFEGNWFWFLTTTKPVWGWIKIGGKKEDIPYWYMPYLRSVNHFHNPLTDQGFSGIWGTGFLSGESSIQWTQEPVSTQSPGGYYSWYDVRDYFYKALTSTDKTIRETNFADMFRGIGQIVHLVEDLSVPEHTRNDGHYVKAYEAWVKGSGNDGEPNVDIDFLTGIISIRDTDLQNFINVTPIFYDSSAIGNPNPLAPVPFANLFDTNQYNGTNPDITRQSNIGLSEYTNANFLSPDTMFTANFPYPDWNSVVEYDEVIDVTAGKTRTYLKKLGFAEGGYGESINHLAAGRWFYKYLPSNIKNLGLKLDKRVYSDYAQKLIPRAVGYSAGLLDYFFRGELFVALLVPSNDGPSVEGIWGNQTDTGVDIDKVAVFVQNNSKLDGVVEPIGAGILTLTVSYTDTKGTPDPDDDTIEYESAGSVSVTDIPETGSGSYAFALFTLTNPIQPNQTVEDLTYHLAFKGQLGNEQDAVIGRVIKSPVLHSVSPDEGKEGDVITITGNNLPMPPTSDYVRFQHNLTEPYTVELLSKTDTEIIVKVPNTAALVKPEYGGLRVVDILASGEKIYSTSLIFFPIAEGEVTNTGGSTIDVTITADAPIVGDNNQLPLPPSVNITGLAPGASLPVNLKTGYNYTASANSTDTQDIEFLKPGEPDFIFNVD